MLSLGIIILALLVLGTLLSLFYPIGGTWERMPQGNPSIWNRERIVLKQLSIIITGKQMVSGGTQKFFGFAFGPFVWLKRRDYGLQALINEGFPEPIAKLIQGRVLLHLNLKLSSDKLFLKGHAIPFKVEFFQDGSGIKSVHKLDPIPRDYHRTELTPVTKPTIATVGKPVYSEYF